MPVLNAKVNKYCAICKYWNDPTNSAIEPLAPAAGSWKFDNHALKMCLLSNIKMPATGRCPKFVCKL